MESTAQINIYVYFPKINYCQRAIDVKLDGFLNIAKIKIWLKNKRQIIGY
jgi:hypothetical protein